MDDDAEHQLEHFCFQTVKVKLPGSSTSMLVEPVQYTLYVARTVLSFLFPLPVGEHVVLTTYRTDTSSVGKYKTH